MYFTTLEKIGLVVAVQIAGRVGRMLYKHVISPGRKKKHLNLREMGSWAVVTGATQGIGQAYVYALARQGINIVLISRSLYNAGLMKSELEKFYHVQAKIIVADFYDDTEEAYRAIQKQLYGLEIGILINNVTQTYPQPDYFLDLPDKKKVYSQIVKCNIGSVTNMCLLLLPKMIERGKGVVVNVSSTAAMIPSPMLTVYAASKAFIEKFSKDLDREYQKHGIIVQCLLPGFIKTRFNYDYTTSIMVPRPEVFVESAIRTIGIQKHTTGYFPHTVTVGAINFIEGISPAFINWLFTRLMTYFRTEEIRGRQRKFYW